MRNVRESSTISRPDTAPSAASASPYRRARTGVAQSAWLTDDALRTGVALLTGVAHAAVVQVGVANAAVAHVGIDLAAVDTIVLESVGHRHTLL